MLSGTELLIALGRTRKDVKVVDLVGAFVYMPAEQALLIVRDSQDYVGNGSKRKVGSIRRVKTEIRKPDPIWERCWRTCSAAVLPPSHEWFEAKL